MRTLARYTLLMALVWPAGTGMAQAQTPAVSSAGLSIEALVAMALERAPMVEAARRRIEVAEGQRTQASLRPNPVVGVDRLEQLGGADSQTRFSLTVPLDLFRRDARVAVADHDVRRADALAALERIDRAAAVRIQATQVLAATRQRDVVRQVAQAARTRFELLTARVESGAAMPLERDLADVEWRRTQVELAQWQGEVEAAMAQLKAVVGWPVDESLLVTTTLEDAVAALPPRPVSAPAAAVAVRPDVLAAEAVAARADAQQQLARREGRLDLGVTGGYMWRVLGRDRMNEVMFGVMVDLPWRNRQQGAIASAIAEGFVARAEVSDARLQAEAEMAAAMARDVAATAVVERYRAGLAELAAKNLEVVREMWSLGRGTLFDVIEEERRYLDLQSAYTAALRDLSEARAAVLRAWGVQS